MQPNPTPISISMSWAKVASSISKGFSFIVASSVHILRGNSAD